MSRGTVRIALLLISALYVSAIRQPLAVLEPVDPTLVVPQAVVESVPLADAVVAQEAAVPLGPSLINPVTPQAALEAVPAEAVVAQEALPPVDPTAAAADVAPVAVDSELVTNTPVDAALPVDSAADDAGISAQAVTTSAVDAYGAGTLGVGYSGSGFLIMYHVGVSAILRALGFFDKTAGFAGASGGSVAAAYSCSKGFFGGPLPQMQFRAGVEALLSGCRRLNNCRGTLDTALRTGTLSTSYATLNTADGCDNKLYIAVTRANPNSLTLPAAQRRDQRVFVSGTWTPTRLSEAVAASSFIPRFSGTSGLLPGTGTLRAVTRPVTIGVTVAYDGVATNPLPVPPSSSTRRITYTITVSAVVNETNASGPPTTVFDSLITTANDGCNPGLFGATAANCPVVDSSSRLYMLLDPVKVTQPAIVDIYPGLSGPLAFTNATWNSFVLKAPSMDEALLIYNQGRADARAWVRAAFPATGSNSFSDAELDTAMEATK